MFWGQIEYICLSGYFTAYHLEAIAAAKLPFKKETAKDSLFKMGCLQFFMSTIAIATDSRAHRSPGLFIKCYTLVHTFVVQ